MAEPRNTAPTRNPGEIYTVKADSQTFGTDSTALDTPATCCTPEVDTGQADQATQSAGCCS